MPFTAYYMTPEGDLRRGLGEPEVQEAFEANQGLLWVDVVGITHEEGQFLEQALKFHHLAVEDCVSPRVHSPKIDDFGDYLFIVVHGINHEAESDIVETSEMAIFLGSHYVVSTHNFPLFSVDAVRRLVEDDGRPMRRGADFLAHALIDALIDNVLPTVDKMDERADEIEEEVILSPERATLSAILQLKRSALHLHRVLAPQRTALNQLSRGEFPTITEAARIFYRDIYDHIVRIEDLNQTLRDRADNALATYLSSVANRQNETIKALSLAAVIFMPLTLLAGIYGMNFDYMPELQWRWGYFALLGFMVTFASAATLLFWGRGWLTRSRGGTARGRPFAVTPAKLPGYKSHPMR
ncbi:MAG TPA: magnesium/cobalt transporter CorA [Dehalococcoidia bacterium]|nr:magnesium/cobalt transporter CorA [Dehalococcoidia bacterium]